MARKNSKTAKIAAEANVAIDAEMEALIADALDAGHSEADIAATIDYTMADEALRLEDVDFEPSTPPSADLSFIDESMETAASAGIVDHGSHIGYTWVSPELANEVLGSSAEQVPGSSAFEVANANHYDEDVNEMVFAIKAEVDTREFFENQKNPENANIQRTLKKVRSQLVTKRAARVFLTCQVHPSFINRVLHDGSRYNVYALGKLSDIVFGLTGGILSNAINLACLRSLFACSKAGVTFTMETARACASNKIHIDPAVRKHLTRHTVSASTAPTQASSTMQALATLKVVNVGGTTRAPIYTPADTPIAERLAEMFAA